jgi:hypothetical protein
VGEASPTHSREAGTSRVNACFWPIADPAHADYEGLRESVLTGGELLAARGSLAGAWLG